MKIKPLTKEQLIISVDRLTRFKETETKYLRVFKDIIINNLIEPKIKKHELDKMDYSELTKLAQEIINSSVPQEVNDLYINQKLYEYENSIFNINDASQTLLKNQINYTAIVKLLPTELPNNLKWFKTISPNTTQNRDFGYPVKKVLLCEGITEEILLPVFSKLCNFNFDEHGIHIISAGGKNQVVKYFYNFAECLKIPIFVLLDNDAKKNLEEIQPKLRNIDKIHLLKSGEFEDMLPISLIARTLNFATQNISIAPIEGLQESTSKVEFLEDFFKHRGLHEFKKAEFANLVKQNIKDFNDVSVEIQEIISEIKGTYSPLKNGV